VIPYSFLQSRCVRAPGATMLLPVRSNAAARERYQRTGVGVVLGQIGSSHRYAGGTWESCMSAEAPFTFGYSPFILHGYLKIGQY
jgi:hypothetical protein